MDAIKSYFNKILSPNHVMRKGSGKWKREQSSDRARFGLVPHRSASTSHVDLDSYDPDMIPISMGSMRMFTPTLETFKSPQRISDTRGSSREGLQQSKRDIMRTPPPSKPPRRDLVFSIQLDTEGLNDIGVEIDCLPPSTTSSRKFKPSEMETQNSKVQNEETDEDSSSVRTNSGQHDAAAENSTKGGQGLTFKVVALTQGSRCNLDGRVNVNDEIVDINGESLHKETRESVRSLLENAIKSGHVVLTIRRRRKRATEPPAVPTRQTSLLQCSHRLRSASSDDLLVSESSCASNLLSGDTNCRTRSLDDSLLPEPIALEDSNADLNISSDDVFADSTTPFDKVTYINLPHLRFHKHSTIRTNGKLPALLANDSNKLDPTDNTSSASDDLTSESSKTSEGSSHPEYFLPRDNTSTFRKGSSTSTLVEESDCKIESSSSRKESADSTNNKPTHGQPRYVKGNTGSVMAAIESRPSQTTHGMSMSAHEGDVGMPNSPLCKKRVVSTLSLMKDKSGLGIHIAGGKGCKKGDIGIFVAAVTEGGAADRDGRLKKGDELLMINGQTLVGMTHKEAVAVLKKSEPLVKIVVASKMKKSSSAVSPTQKLPDSPRAISHDHSGAQPADSRSKLKPLQFKKLDKISKTTLKMSDNHSPKSEVPGRSQCRDPKMYGGSHSFVGSPTSDPPQSVDQSPGGTAMKWEDLFEKFQPVKDGTVLPLSARYNRPISITVVKGAGGKGLGFSVVGGCDSLKGDKGVVVKKVYRHGVIALDGHLREGDEILALNNQQLSGLTHKAVMSLFRSLTQGAVKLTFRPRTVLSATSPMSSSDASSFGSRDGSPVSTPKQSPYTSPRNSICDTPLSPRDNHSVQKLIKPVPPLQNTCHERQLNGNIPKRVNTTAPLNAARNGPEVPKVKAVASPPAKQGLQRESLLPPMPKSSPKPGDKGKIGVVTPLSNQQREGTYHQQKYEHMDQVSPGQLQNLIMSPKQVIKAQHNSSQKHKTAIPNKPEHVGAWTNDRTKLQHQAELAEILKNCTEQSSPMQHHNVLISHLHQHNVVSSPSHHHNVVSSPSHHHNAVGSPSHHHNAVSSPSHHHNVVSSPSHHHNVVSSPKSSSVVKMQVKPVETHVAQSSPVMNLHSFKPAGIAVKYPPVSKEGRNSKQVFTSPGGKQPHYADRQTDKSTKSGNHNQEDGVIKLAETRIQHDHDKATESPIVRPKTSHGPQNPHQKAVDRVDQQLRENRKQIDVSSPIIGQRRNCHSTLTPARSLNDAHTDMFASHSKTLPRLHHHAESCHHQNGNIATLYQQSTAHEENLIKEQSRNILQAPVLQKNPDVSMSPGCYSSLPRGHNLHHSYHPGADNYRPCQNQTLSQCDSDSLSSNDNTTMVRNSDSHTSNDNTTMVRDSDSHTSNDNTTRGRGSFCQTTPPLSSQLSDTEILLQNLMKPVYGQQLSMQPFNDSPLSFFNHDQAFTRLSSTPKSLLSIDSAIPFSTFNSPMQAFNQQPNDRSISPNSSIKSFTQASFFKYQSNEVTTSYQANSLACEKQIQSGYDNQQGFSNATNPLVSGNGPHQHTSNLFSQVNASQIPASRNMTESAYGHLTGHAKSSHITMPGQDNMQRDQNINKIYRFEISINKDGGLALGINVVRKTVTGASNIFIQDIIPGSSAEKDNRLRKGDCILSVNGVDLKNLTLLEAHELFRNLPPGHVHITASRDMSRTMV